MKKFPIIIAFLLPLILHATVPTVDTYSGYGTLQDYAFKIFSPNVVTTHYISNSGSNSNDGLSTGAAWATISKIAGSFGAGDIILIEKGGTYTGGLVNISSSGSSGNPITVGTYGTGAMPKITGSGSTILAQFYLNNKNYWTFDGLEIYDPAIDTTSTTRTVKSKIERAFEMDGTSNHNIIKNCKIRAVGVGAYFVGNDNTMDNCYVADLTMVVDTNDGGQPGNDDDYGANPVVISGDNNIITHNRFLRCWAHSYDYTLDGGGVELAHDSGNPSTDGNFIAYNYMNDCIGICEYTGPSTGTVWAYNILINNGATFYIQNTGVQIDFYNNVVVENVTTRLAGESKLFSGSSTTLGLKNNIFYLTNGMDVTNYGSGVTHENNLYRTSGSSTIGYTPGVSEATTSSTIFLSESGAATGWDYQINSGSPAYHLGQAINTLSKDYFGNTLIGIRNAGVDNGAGAAPANNTIAFPATINGILYGSMQ